MDTWLNVLVMGQMEELYIEVFSLMVIHGLLTIFKNNKMDRKYMFGVMEQKGLMFGKKTKKSKSYLCLRLTLFLTNIIKSD